MCKNKLRISKSVRNIEEKFNDGESETGEENNAAYTMEHIGAVSGPKKWFVNMNINLPEKSVKSLKCQLDKLIY